MGEEGGGKKEWGVEKDGRDPEITGLALIQRENPMKSIFFLLC